MKKLIFLCLLFLGVSTVSFSQSKTQKRATEIVEKMNSNIKKVDKTLAFSEKQKTELIAIQLKRFTELNNLGKKGTKAEKNAINKKYIKQSNKKLTKEQMKAQKKGSEMGKK